MGTVRVVSPRGRCHREAQSHHRWNSSRCSWGTRLRCRSSLPSVPKSPRSARGRRAKKGTGAEAETHRAALAVRGMSSGVASPWPKEKPRTRGACDRSRRPPGVSRRRGEGRARERRSQPRRPRLTRPGDVCPKCRSRLTEVTHSRHTASVGRLRYRRCLAPGCGLRWTTEETFRVMLPPRPRKAPEK